MEVHSMAKAKQDDRQARLDKLRAKLAKTDMGVGSGDKKFFKPEEGQTVIRILPPVHDMDFFFQSVGQHWMPDANSTKKRGVYCPKFTSEGELECPVCEIVHDLYRAGDKASKDLAGELRASKQYWMNVIIRGREDEGPKIYPAGPSVFAGIVAYINDPDYGDITDPYDGHDITIIKEKTGSKPWEVEYQVIARPKQTPVAVLNGKPDESKIEAWLEDGHNLTWAEATMNPEDDKQILDERAIFLLPYDRIVKEFALDNTVLSDDEDDEEVYEEVAPSRRPRTVVLDEDDEELEPTEVQQEISKRRARRTVTRRTH